MIDFPATPVAGQIFFAPNGVVYQYSSTYTSWVPVAPSSGVQGDVYGFGTGAQIAPTVINTWFSARFPTIISGNQTGAYNTTTGAFTPPAGRWRICANATFNSSASGLVGQIKIRKNTVDVVTTPPALTTGAANAYGTVTVEAVVDANGTDVFDIQTQSTVLWSNAWGNFVAFPISGAQQLPGTGSSWRLISRTVIAAPQATLDLQNIPADINDLELRFDLLPVSNDTGLFLKFYDGGGTLQSANYVFTTDASQTNIAGGGASVVMNSVALGSAVAGALSDTRSTRGVNNTSLGGARGRATLNNIRDTTRVKSYDFVANHLSGDATTWIAVTGSGMRNTTGTNISGLQLLFGTGNIASGVVSLWGSP